MLALIFAKVKPTSPESADQETGFGRFEFFCNAVRLIPVISCVFIKFTRMKKLLSISGSLALLFSLTACNNAAQPTPNTPTTTTPTTSTTTNTTTTTTETKTAQADPSTALYYSLGKYTPLDIKITNKEVEADTLFTAEGLKSLESDCQTTHPAGYLEGLVAKLKGLKAQDMTFTSATDPAEIFEVMVVPNIGNYALLDAVKKDFDTCAAGGNYPIQVTKNWILFDGACGGAIDELPKLSCQEMENEIVPSMQLLN